MANANLRRKKKNVFLSTDNLFHHPPRNQVKSSSTTLPIITLSSLSNILRMATKKSPSTSFSALDFRMEKIKSHIRSLSRTNVQPVIRERSPPKKIHRSPKARDRHSESLPTFPNRVISARVPIFPAPPPPPPSSVISLQSHNQYGHFLAYLRRKSLARQRRKRQEEEEGFTNHIEATIRYTLTKQSSSSILFPSSSSTVSLNTNLSSLTTKRNGRLSTSLRAAPPKKPVLEDPLLTTSSLLITPRNSVVDDETMFPTIKPSEFYLNDDKLRGRYSGRYKHLRTSIVYI